MLATKLLPDQEERNAKELQELLQQELQHQHGMSGISQQAAYVQVNLFAGQQSGVSMDYTHHKDLFRHLSRLLSSVAAQPLSRTQTLTAGCANAPSN